MDQYRFHQLNSAAKICRNLVLRGGHQAIFHLEGVPATFVTKVEYFYASIATSLKPPSDEDVLETLQRIIKRVMKQLVHRGILVEDQGVTYLAYDTDDCLEARTLRPLHRGFCVYCISFGPRAGQKVLTFQGALPKEASGKQKLCATIIVVLAGTGHRLYSFTKNDPASRFDDMTCSAARTPRSY